MVAAEDEASVHHRRHMAEAAVEGTAAAMAVDFQTEPSEDED